MIPLTNLTIRLFVLLLRLPHAVWLGMVRAGRRSRESTWIVVNGNLENVAIIIPEGSYAEDALFPGTANWWRVELTFSYSHAGQYYSGRERRTFLARSGANRFLGVLGDYTVADAITESASRARLHDLSSLSGPPTMLRVAVNAERPSHAFVVGFFEDAEGFARNISRSVVAR